VTLSSNPSTSRYVSRDFRTDPCFLACLCNSLSSVVTWQEADDDEDEQAFDEEKPTWDDDIDISDIVPPAAVEEKSDDDDDDDETGLSAKQRKKKRRAKAFAEKHRALTTKQQGTAGEGASHVEPKELSKEEIDKILEEYYQLDYEDMVRRSRVEPCYMRRHLTRGVLSDWRYARTLPVQEGEAQLVPSVGG